MTIPIPNTAHAVKTAHVNVLGTFNKEYKTVSKEVKAVTTLPDLLKPEPKSLVSTANFQPKKRLTLDVNSITKVKELLCQTTSELYLQDMPSKFHPEGKASAYCVDVIDLLRAEEYMLVCNAILTRSLQRAGEPLLGRYFAIRCGEIEAGKTYRRVEVVELERKA